MEKAVCVEVKMRVYIWGTGARTKKLLNDGIRCEIAGFIETEKSREIYEGAQVLSCSEIQDAEYDLILVASIQVNEIYKTAQMWEMDLSKFVFLHHCLYANPRENLDVVRDILSEKNFQIYLAEYDLYELSFWAQDKAKYEQMNQRKEFQIQDKYIYPIISEKYQDAGVTNTYFWQDLWAARLIYRNRPKRHFDIGSRLDGFIAHILAMDIPCTVLDVRPFPCEIKGLDTIVTDATRLEEIEDGSIESLSALCSLEHFGLGRYGDEVNPEACFECFDQIQKKLKCGGRLYIAVPVGEDRVEFNAHRIFDVKTILNCFDRLTLKEFSCIVSNTEYRENIDVNLYDEYFGKKVTWGLFYFQKENA